MTTDDRRSFDIVLFGATGFTGGLTADYLAANAPDGCRWAIAGRDPQKLAAVQERLTRLAPAKPPVPTIVVDAADPAAMAELAAQTQVVITTVGPYILYGEPLVAACAAAGTDYVDLTGEPEFVDRMYLAHHETAVRSGARILHACGFDSIPHDLGAYFTVQQLPEGVPLKVRGYVQAGGRPSGGTVHSGIHALSRMRQMAQAARQRAKADPKPTDRKIRSTAGLPGRRGGWALPMPGVDSQIVGRSAKALDRYGPDFSYRHHVVVKHLAAAAGASVALPPLFLMAQFPPTRRFLFNRIQPGDGPSEEQREKSWFRVGFDGEGGGQHVSTEVSGGDPGYGETAKMLSETALCLAFDDLPKVSGQVTTAVACGNALIERLQRAGITFRVV
jgi:short subunit dehydrogenase-like uncharacterized protein